MSYVGIANSLTPPQETYRHKYDIFAADYNRLRELLIVAVPASNHEQQIVELYDFINTHVIVPAQDAISSLNSSIESDSGIPRFLPGGGFNAYGNWVSMPVPNSEYSPAQERIAANTARRNNIERILTSHEPVNPLTNASFVSGINYLMRSPDRSIALTNLESSFHTEFSNFDATVRFYHDLYSLIDLPSRQFSPSLSAILLTASRGWDIDDYLQDSELRSFNSIVQRAQELEAERTAIRSDLRHVEAVYSFLLQGTESPILSDMIFRELRHEISLQYRNIQRAVMAVPENDRGEIEIASNSLSAVVDNLDLQSPFTLATFRLWPTRWNGEGADVILAVLFAIIVDGLTLLIPFTAEKRRGSVLFSQSSNDFRADQEDILEKMLLSLVTSGLISSTESGSPLEQENKIFDDILRKVYYYMHSFEVSPCTQPLGYPTRKKVTLTIGIKDSSETLDSTEPELMEISSVSVGGLTTITEPSSDFDDMNGLTAFLLEMGYIKYVSMWEYEKLQKDYHAGGESWAGDDDIDNEPENGYYLMKRQFIMWMNDNQLSWFTKR